MEDNEIEYMRRQTALDHAMKFALHDTAQVISVDSSIAIAGKFYEFLSAGPTGVGITTEERLRNLINDEAVLAVMRILGNTIGRGGKDA